MEIESIVMVSLGYFENGFLENVTVDVEREFSLPVHVKEGHFDLSDYYDLSRSQYNGNRLLHEVDERFSSNWTKTLGILNVDLFIPILTYIFGQAFLNGKSGIASIYRLGNERYGMAANESLLIERFRKEAIHELGHTFGLIHCHDQDCVMRSSTYVEDIDQKSHHLCKNCRIALAENP
jgi:archaemetzincin